MEWLRIHVCFSPVWLFATPWTVAHQAPLSMGFSRQEYWSGLPCPLPEDLPNPGIKPTSLMSPAMVGRFFTTSATWSTKSRDGVDSREEGTKTCEEKHLLHWVLNSEHQDEAAQNQGREPRQLLLTTQWTWPWHSRQRSQTHISCIPSMVLLCFWKIQSLTPPPFASLRRSLPTNFHLHQGNS